MEQSLTIVVCGAGTMGSGIAQTCIQQGITTILFDVNEAMLGKARNTIEKNILSLAEKGRLTIPAATALQSITYTSSVTNCKADIIIEAIVENKEAKQLLFRQLSAQNSSHTIFATNTSSISVNAIAEGMENASRIAGMHFFNPAPIMKLVEIVKTEHTSDEVIDTLFNLCRQLNKTPVLCKDAPGFIVNRVARHYYLEAMKLVELELASIEEADAVMEAAGFKMGPFKLMDLIGMDINYNVSCIVWEAMGKPGRLQPSIIQQQKVEKGELGRKTGKGFYTY